MKDLAAPLLPLYDKIQKALAVTKENTWDDLLDAVRSGSAIVFVDGESVLVATGSEQPGGLTLTVWLVAGVRVEVIRLSRAAYLYAKDHGFDRIVTLTRLPIADWPEIKADGYKKRAVYIEREVS